MHGKIYKCTVVAAAVIMVESLWETHVILLLRKVTPAERTNAGEAFSFYHIIGLHILCSQRSPWGVLHAGEGDMR